MCVLRGCDDRCVYCVGVMTGGCIAGMYCVGVMTGVCIAGMYCVGVMTGVCIAWV